MRKIEIRSFFKSIFNTEQDKHPEVNQNLKMLNTYVDVFTESAPASFTDDLTVRTCVDVIARHVSKMQPIHQIKSEKELVKAKGEDSYNYVLGLRPNAWMSTPDFLYRITSKTYMYGNCFIMIKRDESGRVLALHPMDYSSVELKEVDNNIYCRFRFAGGGVQTIPYDDIIHIRRGFNSNEILGDVPAEALKQQIKLLDTCKKGLSNIVKNSTAMRGVLKYNIMVKQKDKEKAVAEFSEIAKNGGIGVIDGDCEYTDLSKEPESLNDKQLKFLREDIYRYYGVSGAILSGDYTEDQWQAFYEGVLESFSIQLSTEFTAKLFTPRQIAAGHQIVFSSNRLQYASVSSKVDMVYKLLPSGVLTISDCLEILNIENQVDPELGNRRFMTLNNTAVSPLSADSLKDFDSGKKVTAINSSDGGGEEKNEY